MRDRNRMACPLSRSQPEEILFLEIGLEASLRSKAEETDIVKQFALASCEDMSKDVALYVLKRAISSAMREWWPFPDLKKKRCKRYTCENE